MLKDATEYEWSSARAHVEGRDALALLDLDLWKQLNHNRDWHNRDWHNRDWGEVLLGTRDEEAQCEAQRAAKESAGGSSREK